MAFFRRTIRNVDVTNAEELISFIERRIKNNQVVMISEDLARLAYLSGRDLTKNPQSILDDPRGSVKIEVFPVKEMLTLAKERLRKDLIPENWGEDFENLLKTLQSEKEAKKIAIFSVLSRKKRKRR